ncbi:hypothetical protein [Amycolatopsis benzoatilytica]|uniref:hypothetical protein n=1 Tax=Amycolatopsis benzoatilytica TaxID=346045 RepID=UPI00036B518E|nr:hypothetical protein [Amycolatopsis benzoatilytica]
MHTAEDDQIGIMGEEKKTAEERKKIRMSSVLAAALAAVTAALLGSTLGVAGTVIGAGVASVVSTVGGELYLRSFQGTRQAAKKAIAGRRSRSGIEPVRHPGSPSEAPTVYLSTDPSEMPTVRISALRPTKPEQAETFGEKLRKVRWPLIIGTSVAVFAVALAVLFTFDFGTKGSGLIARQPDTSQQQDTHRDNAPSSAPQAPATSGSQPPASTSAPTTTQSAPPSSSATQDKQTPTSSSQPSSSAATSGSQSPTGTAPPSNAGQ